MKPRRTSPTAWVWLPGASLVAAGLIIDLVAGPTLPQVVFRVQIGIGGLAVAIGVIVGSVSIGVWSARRVWRRVLSGAVAREREAQADAHRRFLRRLDHELKNPLTAITVGLANLSAAAPPNGAAGSLQNVRRQVDRLSALAGDLRKLGELASRELEYEQVDLAVLVGEVVELACESPTSEHRKVIARVEQMPWAPAPVLADRDLLLLALYNLVDNALKFSRPGGTVEVRAREDGQVVVLEVADTGVGIPSDDLPHVTEELYRGHAPTVADGSGLGLALVERVARLHGGSLTIASRAGEGTLASLRVPASARPVPLPTAALGD